MLALSLQLSNPSLSLYNLAGGLRRRYGDLADGSAPATSVEAQGRS
jgi:hypothetical protein